MPGVKNPTTYDRLVAITHVYLGPAADRFINRQIENHLHKDPKTITKEDLRSLSDWIKVIVGLICDDQDIVEEYTNEIRKLYLPKPKRNKI
ncbi:MAG TPA: hypothetical protein VL989_01930 [Candidatus Sulfotelmatobacter sp.]|nr:hypothetical protein [Candidatus Sulfotelmatobacter sp.]